MTPAEAGRAAAQQAPPLSDEQVENAARLLAAVARDQAETEAAS